jgi:ribonucleoside-diphosphate reductase subunit M1
MKSAMTSSPIEIDDLSIDNIISQVCSLGGENDRWQDGLDIEWIKGMYQKAGLKNLPRIVGSNIKDSAYSTFAGRLALILHQKNCPQTVEEYTKVFEERFNPAMTRYWREHSAKIEDLFVKYYDYNFSGGWSPALVFIKTYSARAGRKRIPREMPMHMYMRSAVQLCHRLGWDAVSQAFDLYMRGIITPPSPMMFNACMRLFCSGSCFLSTVGDTTKSITEKIAESCFTAKANGGQGMDLSNIRHSEFGETGISKGVVPVMQMYNVACNLFGQNSQRPAAAAPYLSVHHIDIMEFIDSRLPTGDQRLRAPDLFPAVWANWLFRHRIATDGDWTVFCPKYTRQLRQLWGPEWAKEYIRLENELQTPYRKTYKARDIYKRVIATQTKAGVPYMLCGDAANAKSNHSHLGVLRMSNLCCEIMEYSDEETTASCNLHSINMKTMAIGGKKLALSSTMDEIAEAIDFEQLATASKWGVICVNQAIDQGVSPLDQVDERGNVVAGRINQVNQFQRAIGLGVAGKADMLALLDIPFECETTVLINKMFFACMYFNAIIQSVQEAVVHGPCGAFSGSHMANGKFQFDLWADELKLLKENENLYGDTLTRLRDPADDVPVEPRAWGQKETQLIRDGIVIDTVKPTWDDCRRVVTKYGMYNSLLIALMPTASSAQIRGICESFEAPQSNLYSRKVYKVNYSVLNPYMVSDLKAINAWTDDTPDYLLQYNGSLGGFASHVVANPDLYPKFHTKSLERLKYLEFKYKTMWNISQKFMIKLAAIRGRYVDQSTSLNIYIRDSDPIKMEAAQMYSFDIGNKTVVYYVRSNGADNAKLVTKKAVKRRASNQGSIEADGEFCDRSNPNCLSCTS